ncbi:MAG TPA: type 1 glutamine amidotransferase [Nocardioidaceae bacterium]|nr:type 1 glutamine amidotransferase [Nocardioidaceae bacterium]
MQPLLVIEHEAQCPPGWMGEWLSDAGAELEVRRPYAGDALPAGLGDNAGLVVLGGEMGANDDATYPWLTEVKRLIVAAAEDGIATLGICLGHQLVAVALGGTVGVNPRGQQLGVLDVGWTEQATQDELFAPLAQAAAGAARRTRAVQWNNDIVVEAPPGTDTLARTPEGELQAARFASRVWGVQWHPEAGPDIIGRWADNDRDHAREQGVDLDRYLAQVAAARAEMRSTWRVLANRFLTVCKGPVRT